MYRLSWPFLAALLLLSACRGNQPIQSTPETPIVAGQTQSVDDRPSATDSGAPDTPESSATAAPGNQVFVPISPGDMAVPEPAIEPALAYPSGPAVTEDPVSPTPGPPIATPEPEFPAYTGPPLDRDRIGLQVYLHRQDMRDIVRHLEALDAGWVKTQVSWKLHEPRPGEYDPELFGELDRLVDAAANHDIQLLLSVSKAPEWSRPTTEEDGPPSDYGRFEDFMRYLAIRYQGRVAAYELWNEPNLRREWNGAPLDPARLVELTRRGAAGVRAVDPGALIIAAAPATTGINDGVNAVDDRVYFGGMLAAGMAGVVDGFGVHPYGWANPPDARVEDAVQVSASHNNHPSFFFADTMADYHDMLVAAGAADKQLWATEFGWGSFDNMLTDEGTPAAPPEGAEFMAGVSEWQQAVYVLRAFELAHDWEWAGPMFLWNLNFAPGIGSAFSESGYSILRSDESRRPAYRALEFRDEGS
jgi:polysaccharide biosynthesis protein PslG